MGHQVKLIAPQYVKPFVKGNKNDYNDAETIAEASQRPNMRFVPIKSIKRQDIQNLHRQRELIRKSRKALLSQVRGLLADYGIVTIKGVAVLHRDLTCILEDVDNKLSALSRGLFTELYDDLLVIEARFKKFEKRIITLNKENETCRRLIEVLGIGPIIASATYAEGGDGKNFVNGRHFSAWLGLAPGQHSTRGKPVLLGISKRGNSYLRSLYIHAARAVLKYSARKSDRFSLWAQALLARGVTIKLVWQSLTN